MSLKAKICGLTETIHVEKCLEYGTSMCGFILFYPKSHRNLSIEKAKELTSIKHSKANVAVMVQPSRAQLEGIKNLNFQYYQIYGDQDPEEINEIKKRYEVKIIKALTIDTKKDVLKYKKYEAADIILFDSIGKEKSLSFDHSLLKYVPTNIKKMVAGNIFRQDLEKINKIADNLIVDCSGSLETNKKKDLTKIKKFLLEMRRINEN